MKKIVLSLMLCLCMSSTAFAQNNMESMRFLTINALMQYGQKLYDRGDFSEACAVFNHVLTYDGHQSQALQYLKDMGHEARVSASPVVPSKMHLPRPVGLMTIKASHLTVPVLNVTDTENLKKAIEAQKKVVEQLRLQIKQMRANIAAQSGP